MDSHPSDIASELALLHTLHGADYARQVEQIALRHEFRPVEGEVGIYACGGESGEDYRNQLTVARKAVAHGFTAFLLPNPKGTRTPDIILKRKNVYKAYDLKTVRGKSSVSNRLAESIGQANNVILNIQSAYNTGLLIADILQYFASNREAREVLVFRHRKFIVVSRNFAESRHFNVRFRRMYEK